MCKIHQTRAFLTDSLKKIEKNLGYSHNDLSASMSVFSTGLRLWGLIDTSKFFFPYYLRLRKIFSGYGMILKRESNFSNRVNDPVSKGEKVPMLTPMEFDSKMAHKQNYISFVF